MRPAPPLALLALGCLALGCLALGCPSTPDPAPDATSGLDASRPDARELDAPRADAGPPAPPPSEPGRHAVSLVESRRIVPGPGLPVEAPAQTSNNNLDVIRFEGRVYLAFRTGPSHFASPEVRLHLVSSDDEVTWRYERSYARTTDLREPRLLAVGGRLFLYLAELGSNPSDFEPMGTLVSERLADGTWTDPAPVPGLENAIAWRTRTERVGGVETPFMVAYYGGEMVYDFLNEPMVRVDLLTSEDGLAWAPYDPAHRTLYVGGASETDFSLDDAGDLVGVMRNEAGDAASGFGSRVCRASAGSLAEWSCRTDPRKFDSPLMFFHDGEHYLVGRRNVTETGAYDLMSDERTLAQRALTNQIAYRNAPKRCALWRYVAEEERFAFILDLPSRGDTCFPARLDGPSSEEIVIYDYTSDPEGPDVPWHEGQEGPTFIYRHALRFEPR
jgi:hypothetical protein